MTDGRGANGVSPGGGTGRAGKGDGATVFPAAELAAWTGGEWLEDRRPETVRGFHFDSRLLRPGDCFAALGGGARDGHDYVESARERGASAALVRRPVRVSLPQLRVPDVLEALGVIAGEARRRFAGPVVAVTGSSGKTSTKEMLRHVLGAERTHATRGNWNNRIGVPMTLFALAPGRHRRAVIEAGINQPGEMEHLGRMIAADAVVVTNIGPAHLELLGSEAAIAREKAALARQARPGAPVFVDASAAAHEAFRALGERLIVVAEAEADVPEACGNVLRYTLGEADDGGRRLRFADGGPEVRLGPVSRGMCANAALAVAVARHLGIGESDTAERLRDWAPAGTRGRVAVADGNHYYVDCYNANPASMLDALAHFPEAVPSGLPRCYVLGAMEELGGDAEAWHREVGGRIPFRAGDRLVLVGAPELTAAYAEGARASGFAEGRIRAVEDAAAVADEVGAFAGALFLKGSRTHALETLLPQTLRESD